MDDEAIRIDEGKIADGLEGVGIQPIGAFGQVDDEAAAEIAERGALGDEDAIGSVRVFAFAEAGGPGVEDGVEGGGLAEGEMVAGFDTGGGDVVREGEAEVLPAGDFLDDAGFLTGGDFKDVGGALDEGEFGVAVFIGR